MSSSSSRTQNQQSSSTNVKNLNLQDTEGVTIADSTNVQVSTTDYGAIEVAGDFGADALDAASQIARDASDLGIRSLEVSSDLIDNANAAVESTAKASLTEGFDFGREVLDSGMNYFTESLDFAGGAVASADESRDAALEAGQSFFGQAIDAAGGFFDRAIEAAAGALQASQSQVADTTASLGAIAKDQSTSEASRLQQVVLYALGAVALITIFGRAR